MPLPRTLPRRAALFVLLAALSGAALQTFAAPFSSPVSDAQFQPVFQRFQAAQTGDKSSIEPAAEQFEELLKADPANPLLMAYTGAATALKARATMLPWKKIGHAEDGLAQIDKALALLAPEHDTALMQHSPVSLQVRFVAASTFSNLPGFFNRGARGAKLLAEVQASPLFASATPGFQGAVLMFAAQRAAKDDRVADARRSYAQVVERGLPQADAARAQLQGLPQ
jgi:hypothetical protein